MDKITIADTSYTLTYTFEKDTGHVNITYPHFDGLCDTNIRNGHNYFFTEYIVKPNKPDTNSQLVNTIITYNTEFKNDDILIIGVTSKKTYLDALVPSDSYHKSSYIFETGNGQIANIHNCFTKPQDLLFILKLKFIENNTALDTSKLNVNQIHCLPQEQNILFYCNLEEVNRIYSITDSLKPIAEALIPTVELKEFINEYGPFKKMIH